MIYKELCSVIFILEIFLVGGQSWDRMRRESSACFAPELENGMVKAEKSLRPDMFSGTFECNRGFVLYGGKSVKCRNGVWSNSHLPVCSAVGLCTPSSLPMLKNGRVQKVRRMRGAVYRFRCNRGYKLIGSSSTHCSKKGWVMMAKPVCAKSKCDESVLLGKYGLEHGSASSISNGAAYRFACDDGATLSGSSMVFCDGTKWNDTLPACNVPPSSASLSVSIDDVQRSSDLVANVGQTVELTCSVSGGHPPPIISYIINNKTVHQTEGLTTSYRFTLQPLHTDLTIYCQADNSLSINPVISNRQRLTLKYAPASVTILGDYMIPVDVESHFTCQAAQSRPASEVSVEVLDQHGQTVSTSAISRVKQEDEDTRGISSAAVFSVTVSKGVRKLFILCRASNSVGMVMSEKTVDITYVPDTIHLTGPDTLRNDNEAVFTCSTSASNPEAFIYWKVVVDDATADGSDEGTEVDVMTDDGTMSTTLGWVTTSEATLTFSPYINTVNVSCVAEMADLDYKQESKIMQVMFKRAPSNITWTAPSYIVQGQEALVECSVEEGNPKSTVSLATRKENVAIIDQITDRSVKVLIPERPIDDIVELTCSAENDVGVILRNITLPVLYPPKNVKIEGSSYLLSNQQTYYSCACDDDMAVVKFTVKNHQKKNIDFMNLNSSTISVSADLSEKSLLITCLVQNDVGTDIISNLVPIYDEADSEPISVKYEHLNSIEINYVKDVLSRKKVVLITEAEVIGNLKDIVEDTSKVKQATIMYKTEEQSNWLSHQLDIVTSTFQENIQIPDYCQKYQFKIRLEGYLPTKEVTVDLQTTLGPADANQTGLIHVPPVSNLNLITNMRDAVVEWSQPTCVSGYKYAVYHLEDCDDEDEFEDCFIDFGLEIEGNGTGLVNIDIPTLDMCREYVIMVKTFNEWGVSSLVSNKFRMRESNVKLSTEDLLNHQVVGHQVDGETHIPTITGLTIVPDMETATVNWRQPECFTDYEIQLIHLTHCHGDIESCDEEFSPMIYESTETTDNSHTFKVLDSCSQYMILGRTTGDIGDGLIVSSGPFTTLPNITPEITNITMTSIDITITSPSVSCLSGHEVTTCLSEAPHICTVNTRLEDQNNFNINDLSPNTDYILHIKPILNLTDIYTDNQWNSFKTIFRTSWH